MDAQSPSSGIDAYEDNGEHAVENEDEKAKLLARKNSLIEKLEQVRIDRLSVQHHIGRTRELIDEWNHVYNAAEYERSKKQTELGDVLHQLMLLDHRIELYSRCNVTNDCFYIWHRGKYGTINGLRIGYVDNQTNGQVPSEGDKGTSTSNGYLRMGGSNGHTKSISSAVRRSSTQNHSSSQSKITWLEVNTALGLAAHLLFILQKKQDSFIRFTSYEIMPMGSYTKIGEKQQDPKPPIWYNLYYNDEHSLSFLFSQRRIFNKALNGIGRCLADAIECAKKRDRTLVMPYSIVINAQGILSIENLPITLGNNGDEWTRAMKYFLTDLKWLVVYTTKHVDR